jgi:putative ABC transport system permease protein
MNVVSRGIRNAFRNTIRTTSIVVILGISIGLSLTMLLARQAVQQKIADVQSSVGNTITITPAGFSGFSSVNNSLTTSELSKVSSLPHVTGVTESLTDRLTTIGSTTPSFGGQSTTSSTAQTSLTSPVTINTSGFGGGAGGGGGRGFFISGGGTLPTNFTPPISITGTNDPTSIDGTTLTITGGTAVSGTSNTNEAMISKSMASKNNLKVGSTFTAYGTTITVSGIFTSSDEAAAGTVIVSLPTEQSLSGQTGDVTNAVATVDSLTNLSSVTSAIKSTLGSSTADVTNSQTAANNTIAPLNSVKNISLFSLIGAVIAGAIIILLVMIMIVRERRREIGVLKAIGGSNVKIILQFITEAITLTVLGAVIGLIIGVVGGTPVTKILVDNSTNTTTSTTGQFTPGSSGITRGRGGGGSFFATRLGGNNIVSGVKDIKTAAGWSLLLYGFGSAILIAILGSTFAAGLIAKVRPAEVLRTE